MPAKRLSVEEIVAELREAERLQGEGVTIPQTCERLGISDQTFYSWRIKYGALKEDEAQRLKALEQESARLKEIVAEQRWTSPCSRISSGENGEPARRRDAARYLVRRPQVSGVGLAVWSGSIARRSATGRSRLSTSCAW